eukprot:TRINITY_DN2186_c0_g1_i1.p1 TRINITY_DN2186_c0_g1~~TRINITY_DN2186_c0_g1_i1.p1  ORF type:complete len:696 (+),score=123.14 TRINITY_DN2186_c0_g1_i1:56-2143(+)
MTSPVEYLIGFNKESPIGKDHLNGVVAYTIGKLQEHGLLVERDAAGDKLFLVVTAPISLLELEAERLQYLKTVKGGEGMMEFVKEASHQYEGYESSSFWTNSELAELLESVLEQVDGVSGIERFIDNIPRHNRHSALKVPSSLVAALRICEIIESASPLPDQSATSEIWRQSRFSLLSPDDSLTSYFGSGVGLYFCWLNTFTVWLLLPAAIGFCFFLHMQFTEYTVDDHPYLPFYSIFIVFWAAIFLKCWSRKGAEKAWKWGVFSFGNDLLRSVGNQAEIRPEFRGELRVSKVTGRPERYYPYYKRVIAYLLSGFVTFLMLCVAFVVMILSLNLQGYIDGKIKWERPLHFPILGAFAEKGAIFDPFQVEYFGLIALVPTMLHVIVIMQLNKLYRNVAERLTENENHRYKEDHENSLILKRFLFESFDCYISLFYLGFIQQDIRRLRRELISLYTVDSLRRVFLETLIPFVITYVTQARRDKSKLDDIKKRDKGERTVIAIDELTKPDYEQFDDYLEMVIEYGYVTLFAAAFPLAAFLSVLCNLVEMKSDLFKLTTVYRRPPPTRQHDIGIWYNLLCGIMWLSVFTNTMLFACSEQLAVHFPSLYREANERDVISGIVASISDSSTDLVVKRGAARWVLIIAFGIERIIYLLVILVMAAIPSIPESVENAAARLEYTKNEALKEKYSLKGSHAHQE